ncbi:hypothetical protein [Psychromonas sp.]|uniref:hypothetical protein n=1 Tax=Psychromonas sp. TaxID=1884585 RepID=UPI00356AA920
MWLPDLLYQHKPHLLVGAGVLCIVTFDNAPGDLAGWLLLAAGGLIYWARKRK